MAILLRSFRIDNPQSNHFVKMNSDKKQLLATLQSNVGSRLVHEADMFVKRNGVVFMVMVDTDTENMQTFETERLPIVKKVINFLETTFKN